MITGFFKPTIVLDLDNTLVECTKYYEDAKVAAAQAVESALGMPAEIALDLLRKIDVAAIQATHDFSRARHPNSFAGLAEVARRIMGRRGSEMLVEQLYEIGDSVFDAPYELLPGTEEALESLWQGGFQLVLLTKGDQKVQEQKIAKHRALSHWFRAHYIVPRKSADVLLDVLKREDVDSESSWVVGDSYRDDIAPALEVGVATCHLTGTEGHPGYNQSYDKGSPTIVRHSLIEAVPSLTGYRRQRRVTT